MTARGITFGVEGFEPPTSCSQSRRATRLRYTPRVVHGTAKIPDWQILNSIHERLLPVF